MTRYLDENSGKQIVIETNKGLALKANQSEITSARGGEVDLATKIGKIDSSLSDISSDIDNLSESKLSTVTRKDLDNSMDVNKWDLNDFNEQSRQTILENNEMNINPILGEGGVVEENLANGSVTSLKRSGLGEMGIIVGTVPLEVIITNSKQSLIFKSGAFNYMGGASVPNSYYVLHRKNRYTIPSGTEIDLSVEGTTLGLLYLDIGNSTEASPIFKVVPARTNIMSLQVSETDILLASFRIDSPIFNCNGNFSINGVTTSHNGIKQASLTRTINFNSINKTIEIPSQRLWCGAFGTGEHWHELIPSKILDFNVVLNIGKTFFGIVFNNRLKEFSIKDVDNYILDFNEFFVGSFDSASWTFNQLKQANINGQFTIDGMHIYPIGDSAYLRNGLRIDTIEGTISIPAQRIVTRLSQFDVEKAELKMDLTKNYILVCFDSNSKIFNLKYSMTETIENNEFIVGSWFKGEERIANVNGGFTVNGLNNVDYFVNSTSRTKEDSIYSWWVYPIATRYIGLRDKTYVGFTDSKGNQGVLSIDNKTKHTERKILRKDVVDDHNALSVNVMPNGKLLVAGAGHNSTDCNHIFISKKRENVLEFEDEIRLALPAGYRGVSYAQVLYVGGKYHLFFRCRHGTGEASCLGYRTSIDGSSWSEANIFVSGGTIQYYIKAMKQNETTIKFALTSNTWLDETDVRFGYINVLNGDIKNVDGNILGNLNMLDEPILFSQFNVVISKGNKSLRLLDLTEGEETAIAYCSYIGNGVATNHIAYLNGTDVITVNLPESPGTSFGANIRYHNGVAFIDAHTIVVSRNIDNGWVIERYSNEGTGDFILTERLSESSNPNIKLMRPVVAQNDTNQVFWNRGYYDDTDWTDFYTDIDGTLFNE